MTVSKLILIVQMTFRMEWNSMTKLWAGWPCEECQISAEMNQERNYEFWIFYESKCFFHAYQFRMDVENNEHWIINLILFLNHSHKHLTVTFSIHKIAMRLLHTLPRSHGSVQRSQFSYKSKMDFKMTKTSNGSGDRTGGKLV